MKDQKDYLAAQLREEIVMLDEGVNRFRKKALAAEEKGHSTQQGAGLAALLSVVPALSKAIKADCDLRKVKRYGRVSDATMKLRLLPSDKAALITARTVLDAISRGVKLTWAARMVGSRIEDELRFSDFKKHDPKGYKYALALALTSQHYGYQHRALVKQSRKNELVPTWPKWSQKQIIQVGMKLINLMEMTTCSIKTEMVDGAYLVLPTDELVESMISLAGRLEILNPWFMPTSTPPKPWDSAVGGGYYAFDLPLVKPRHGSTPHVVDSPPEKVLRALNAIQETPWRVNSEVLQVLTILWDATAEALPGIPSRTAPILPDRPSALPRDVKPKDLSPEDFALWKEWRQGRSKGVGEDIRRKSRLLSVVKIVNVAREFDGKGAFYYPHQLDWRGRAYSCASFLQPQGPDLARGLLEFGEGKPLSTLESVRWFLVTGASHFGVDKVSFEDRVAWAEDHMDQIVEVAADPIVARWWREAGEPWQFLAWCLEAARWHEAGRGRDFVSHKVCAVDGSCNGLQHYSAMLRDPRGGKAVNLTPSGVPQDIYGEVAGVVEAKLREMSVTEDTEGWIARAWLKSGLLGRNIVKQQVMTLPYGATGHGMQEQLLSYLENLHDEGVKVDLEDEWAAALMLTKIVRTSINEVVLAAQIAMTWLQDVAKLTAERKLPIRWRTPLGLEIVQQYLSSTKGNIITQLMGGLRINLVVWNTNDRLSPCKQTAGIAPNFVHSLDSCHMMLTVAEMARGGQDLRVSWAMVHDSFGCHAADLERLSITLRQEFVDLYEKHDVLAEFKRDVERDTGLVLPPLPTQGSLEIARVLDSEYFFA